jgi:hypothetical protein
MQITLLELRFVFPTNSPLAAFNITIVLVIKQKTPRFLRLGV